MPIERSDLPFGSEFSPSQISLPRVLELANTHGGDFHPFEAAIRAEYFESHNTSDNNKRKLANNTKLGMIAYGIIDRDANLTDFGRRLFDMRHDEQQLYSELGRHILLNLNGVSLVQCVLDIQASGNNVDLVTLRTWLEQRGIHFPRGGKHPSMMRLWLERAGVFSGGWRVDEDRFQELIGARSAELEALARLTIQQRAYLKALINTGGPGPFPSNALEALATTSYGVRFNEKNLPKQVLYPLRDAGYIALTRGTQEPGRGAKPFYVSITDQLDRDIISPLLDQIEQQIGQELRRLMRRPFSDILEELDVEDRYVRGLALEALAFKLMFMVDLKYVATRLRGPVTGGAEVDLVFESDRLGYTRWQVQCKNTSRVSLEDVAKEVGLTYELKSNMVVIVSTGQIGPEARRYANKVMEDSNLNVLMIDREDINLVITNPIAIVTILNRESRHAKKLKHLDIENE